LSDKLASTTSFQEKKEILRASEINDHRFDGLISQALAAHGDESKRAVQKAEEYAQLIALAEDGSKGGDQSKLAKRIKDSSVYRDDGEGESANWLAGSIRRFQKLWQRDRDESSRGSSGPNLSAVPNFFAVIVPIVWILLGGLLLGFIIYAARFISFSKTRKRKAKAMLEEDEPERTLDEWLALAEAHEREGRFREAVRALYLACLLKFDEKNVARFVRSQTNWEHLARIEASPRLPAGLDFRQATKAFDLVWYGHKVRGAIDVSEFRSWYGAVTDALRGAAA
jgi:hypothetical protein